MIALLIFLVRLLVSPSKPKRRLEAENAALRRQVAVLQRKVRGRVRLTNSDRLFFVLLYRWFPSILKTVTVIKPETLVRWHRAGFRRVAGRLGLSAYFQPPMRDTARSSATRSRPAAKKAGGKPSAGWLRSYRDGAGGRGVRRVANVWFLGPGERQCNRMTC
jgi:hypothetical protein